MDRALYLAVFPIGDTDPANLPVPHVESVLPFYTERLGFAVVAREESPVRRVLIRRDEITLGLAETGGDPEQASCYLSVSDVEAARAEAEAAGLQPSPLRVDDHGGARYRVFFLKDEAGLCYCLGQQLVA